MWANETRKKIEGEGGKASCSIGEEEPPRGEKSYLDNKKKKRKKGRLRHFTQGAYSLKEGGEEEGEEKQSTFKWGSEGEG